MGASVLRYGTKAEGSILAREVFGAMGSGIWCWKVEWWATSLTIRYRLKAQPANSNKKNQTWVQLIYCKSRMNKSGSIEQEMCKEKHRQVVKREKWGHCNNRNREHLYIAINIVGGTSNI